MRSETFGRLLKAGISSIANCEGKTNPIVEEELGTQIGVAAASIQRYKAGHLPPEPRTVQLLAEACVRRGLLGREWTQRLLHAASYPAPDKLLDQICPIGPVRQRPPRVYENLPAPTYSQFVIRAQAFADVIDGLQQRSAMVLIRWLEYRRKSLRCAGNHMGNLRHSHDLTVLDHARKIHQCSAQYAWRFQSRSSDEQRAPGHVPGARAQATRCR